jgi:hypothetical protein
MEQILKEELEALSASYQEKTTKEMLPSWTIVVDVSIVVVQKWKNL